MTEPTPTIPDPPWTIDPPWTSQSDSGGVGPTTVIPYTSQSLSGPPEAGIVDSDASEFHPGESEAASGTTDSDASTFGISDPSLITGLVSYHDAQYTADFTLNGSEVIQWDNHAGSGGSNFDLTDNATSTKRPAYTSGVKVTFDGSSDTLRTSGSPTLSQPSTVLMKAALLTGTAQNSYLADADSTNFRFISTNNSASNVLSIRAGTTLATGSSVWTLDTPFRVAGIFNGTSNSRVEVAGVTSVKGDAGTLNGTGLVLGSSGGGTGQFAKCDIYWVVAYSAALTQGQCLALYNGMS